VTTEPLRLIDASDFATCRDEIAALEAAARSVTGHESLGEGVWRDLAHPAPDSAGFFAGASAYAHVARADHGDPSSWTVSVVKDPHAASSVVRQLLVAAIDYVTALDGHSLACWTFGATSADDNLFADLGFQTRGTLFEMRAPFPIEGTATFGAGVTVRTFEPGRDEQDWLVVNNRAFAGHPDQGDWHESTLRDRMAEDWFDPSLFLLAFDEHGLAGFNWLKQHDAAPPDPSLGEIYVIGIDPRAQGTGLGRALAIAGLQAIHDRGSEAGLLYCAADNTGALALYRSLGFSVHRTDRAYLREVGA
jgi:mycothiol synthase